MFDDSNKFLVKLHAQVAKWTDEQLQSATRMLIRLCEGRNIKFAPEQRIDQQDDNDTTKL